MSPPWSKTDWRGARAQARGHPACPLWISPNPAKEVKRPGVKPKPKEPYTQEEVIQILLACHKLGQASYERDRARAIILLLRYTGLRISEVATLARDRVREDRIYLYRMKNGKPVFLPIPAFLREALDSLPTPKGHGGEVEVLLLEWQRHNSGIHPRRDSHTRPCLQDFQSRWHPCASLPAHLGNCAVGKRLDN
jgi:integrase